MDEAPFHDDPAKVITTQLDAVGVLLATLDMPGRTMNVFSAGLMDALEALMDRVDNDPAIKSVVLTSGKPTFLAGADLVMVRGYTEQAKTASHDQMFDTCGRLGRQFVRLEASAKPWVAAVNGIALGGGLELTLACRERYVADDPKLQLGTPEVRWGLLPGAGGTQRLPRMAPFEAAMDLLLTGRSMAPAEALALGVASGVVPGAQLVETAKAAARRLHGKPYDVQAKFRHLSQAEVPTWNEATARAVAARHGADAERFERYPAYSAIVDAVLHGARLPLAEANTVEMNNFLRLMFSPVAGRMIHTLFLERLRAERELAAPAGAKLERVRHGAISPARAAWAQALGKLKLPVEADDALGEDLLELQDAAGQRYSFASRVLGEPGTSAAAPALWLAPAGPYGRVLEVVGANKAHSGAAAALAARLWCLAWPTPGPVSALAQLKGLALPEQAAEAARLAAIPGAGDPIFLDVAACLSGVSPAWSGGPLTWQASVSAGAVA